MNREKLINYLNLPDSNMEDLPKENSSALTVSLGSSAHFNCVIFDHSRKCQPLWDDLVDETTLSCLNTLGQWPKGHTHRPELCEGLCVPYIILSIALDRVRLSMFDCKVPRPVKKLFQLIFQTWPTSDCSGIGDRLDKREPEVTEPRLSVNSVPSMCRESGIRTNPRVVSRQNGTAQVQPHALPPLATPLSSNIPFVDDSKLLTTCPTRRMRVRSALISPVDLNNNSSSSYQPISPLIRASTEAISSSNSSNQLNTDASFLSFSLRLLRFYRFLHILCGTLYAQYPDARAHHSQMNVVDDSLNRSTAAKRNSASSHDLLNDVFRQLSNLRVDVLHTETGSSNKPSPLRRKCTVTSDSAVQRTEPRCTCPRLGRISSATELICKRHPRPVMADAASSLSGDLAIACQLALLFLPPSLYARLRVLIPSIQLVLSNHVRLGPSFAESVARDHSDNNVAYLKKIFSLSSSNTWRFTSTLLSELCAPILFRTSPSADDSVGDLGSVNSWGEQLFLLMVSDSTNSLLCPPTNLVDHIRLLSRAPLLISPQIPARYPLGEIRGSVGSSEFGAHLKLVSGPVINSKSAEAVPSTRPALTEFHSLPICISSIASIQSKVDHRSQRYPSSPSEGQRISPRNWLASTPLYYLGEKKPGCCRRSRSTDCFNPRGPLRSSGVIGVSHESEDQSDQLTFTDRPYLPSFAGHAYSTSSVSGSCVLPEIDPERLAALGNTAHLITLLNQILNDRQMDLRRKMKWILDFRKTHPDVFWLRFHSQQNANNYLTRLQRRIDAQAQPSVLERITNAFRRRRPSPGKSLTRNTAKSPTKHVPC
ncbi:unnamed protein product [Calicophoron daubneyi]|uniref:Uncharacterized protein n=1 Tax=Calicophoron daubneyi TaxID=300641 RepID=A0AAV2TGG6_CALDB